MVKLVKCSLSVLRVFFKKHLIVSGNCRRILNKDKGTIRIEFWSELKTGSNITLKIPFPPPGKSHFQNFAIL